MLPSYRNQSIDLHSNFSEPFQLSEPVRTHLIQNFIYRRVYYSGKAIEGTV